MSKDLIVKANDLVVAGYELTANEQRLILTAIAKISPTQLDPNTGYEITAKEFSKRFNIHPKTAYRELREAASRLYERSIVIKTREQTLKARWADMIILDNPYFEDVMKDEDWKRVVIWFSPQVIPFLMNLTENFTKYKLSEIAEFSSSYSFRIYEFMMQFQSTGYIKISIKDLRERLQLGDKYPASKDLKLWVIETAVKEINEKSPYKVDYNLIKTGKKFTHLELRFKQKEKSKSLDQKDPNTIDIFDNLTDKEREIIAQKNAYADQIGATAEHRENLIRQGLQTHRQAEQSEQERKQREKAERHAQEQQDKERLELAQRQFEQILNDDRLINAYIANNGINEKNLNGLQKLRFEQGDFKGVFEMEKYKFFELHYIQYLNLNFLNK